MLPQLSRANRQGNICTHNMVVTKATKDYFEKHYRIWRDKQPRGRDTLKRYAAYIGVSRDTVNNWINRGTNPSRDFAPLIAIRCDFEIYDLLGMPRPDPLLQVVMRGWEYVADGVKKEISETVGRAEAIGVIRSGDTGVEVPKPKRKAGG